MRKRLIAWIASLTLVMAFLPACSSGKGGSAGTESAKASAQDAETGFVVRANRDTGSYEVDRPQAGGSTAQTDDGTWTIFVYLCGSDLETNYEAASRDLAEMVAASGNDNVQVVVQTGGSTSWNTEGVDPTRAQRFHIQDTAITEVDSLPDENMGDPSTLGDFLTWGVENYPAEHMGVIVWDHGGGSIWGVVQDENNDHDVLYLRELDEAFASAFATMGDKFEFVGFDACLMGTLETANVMASYANYMVASQEWEPGTGWSYTEFLEYLAKHPGCDGKELGREICDSYLDSFDGEVSTVTLALYDLSKMDDLLERFNAFAGELYDSTADLSEYAMVVRGVGKADNFGGNNKVEGYTNMVDLGGFISACADVTTNSDEVLSALDDVVAYHVAGDSHKDASGISLFYPLEIQHPMELSLFEGVCVSPHYLSYVDRVVHGNASADTGDDEAFADYSDDAWYDDEGNWVSGESETGEEDDHWSFLDGSSSGSGSGFFSHMDGSSQPAEEDSFVSFAVEPQVDEDGAYWFQLDEESIEYVASVSALLYEYQGDALISLGETYDVSADWDSGEMADAFDGWWLSLPDGQNLSVIPVDYGDDYVLYTSRIELNGEETNLRIRQYYDGTCVVEGAWDGISDTGFAAKGLTPIEDGDIVVPLYTAWENDEETTYVGVEYEVEGELEVYYDLLAADDYFYCFSINDIFDDYLLTDGVVFTVDEDGNLSFTALE